MDKWSQSVKNAFSVSAVWFGALVGPSMVSGVFAVVYFAPYGVWSVLLPCVSMGIACVIVGFGLCGSLLWQVDNYYDYGKKLYGRFSGVLSPVLECYIILAMMVGGSSVVAMGGIFFQNVFSLPIFWGQILMAILSAFFVLWGADILRQCSSWVTVFLLLGFLFLLVQVVYENQQMFYDSFFHENERKKEVLIRGFEPAIMLGLSNACNALTLSSVSQCLQSKREILLTIIFSFVLNSTIFIGSVLFLLPFLPEALQEEVPNLYIVSEYLQKNFRGNAIVYQLLMFFGLISSGAPQLNAVCYRMRHHYPKWKGLAKDFNKNCLTALLYMMICMIVAEFGLQNIIAKGYSLLGMLAVPLIVIPLCVIVPQKGRKGKITSKK